MDINGWIVESILGCKKTIFPIKYLGVLLRQNKLKREDWIEVIEMIQRKLEGWQSRFLSLGGRIVFINFVLSAIPLYQSSVLLPR